jgi:hypothetical protein
MGAVTRGRSMRAAPMNAEGRAESKRHPWLLGLGMASAVCAAYLVMVATSWGSVADRSLYANLGMIPIGVAATIVASGAATARTDARTQWAWRLMGAAFACFCAGDFLFFIYQNVLGRSPFPSVADAGYLVYYPLMLAGLLFLPQKREQSRPLGLRSAGCAALFLSGSAAILVLFLLPTLGSAGGDRLAYALSVGYPVGDLLLLAGVAWTLMRRMAGGTITQLLLAGGVCAGLFADVVAGYQNINGISQAGDVPDALFLVSWLFYAWAAYTGATGRREEVKA